MAERARRSRASRHFLICLQPVNAMNQTATIVELDEQLPLETVAPLGRIGIVALSTDFCLEQDIRRMLPDGVEVFTSRVNYRNPMTRENLAAMAPDIGRAAADILPGIGVDVMIYGCTSGTAVIGYGRICDLIRASNPGVPVTTPVTAAVAAFNALDVKRLSVLTPYDKEINGDLATTLSDAGVEVIGVAGLGFDNDLDVTRVAPDDIVRLGEAHCDPDADALFISCTAFRASLALEKLEQRIGKPVVSSNQALAWHSTRLLGCDEAVAGYGKLFSLTL